MSLLLAVAAGLIWHETRGNTLWFDEWQWALNRREGGLGSLLEPHNEHLSLIPLAIYRLLFATAGLDDYEAYRALVIAGHLLCVALLYIYARRRLGGLPALIPAALILFLGPGWHSIIWPFQIGWLISLSAGLGALLLLDGRDWPREIGACALLAVSLAGSGVGVVVTLGVLAEVLWGTKRGRIWIPGVPLGVYAIWWLAYQDSDFVRHNVVLTPGFVADAAASAVSALAGLSGDVFESPDAALAWGRPLAVVAAIAVGWRLATMGRVPPRVVALLTAAFALWILTGLRRAEISTPGESRYVYAGALLTALLAVELARGLTIRTRTWLLVAVVAAAAVIANTGTLREVGRNMRAMSEVTKADLGAVELARPVVRPDFVPRGIPGFPLVGVPAGPYLAAVDDLGSPADDPARIATRPESVRQTVDADLILMHEVRLEPGTSRPPLGSSAAVDAVSGGEATGNGPCVTFRPAAVTAADAPSELQLTLPAAGLLLRAEGGAATVSVRRFADAFPAEPLARIAADGSATLRIATDLSDRPWHVRVAPEDRLTACGLS